MVRTSTKVRLVILAALALGVGGAATPFFVALNVSEPGAAPGGGIVHTKLTEGSNTNDNPATTAPITPTANAQIYAVVLTAASGTPPATSLTITGAGISTWNLVGTTDYGARRHLFIYRGTTASPTTQALTITVVGGNTWTETAWSIHQFTGLDPTTPEGTTYEAANTSQTSYTLLLPGEPGAGDWSFGAFGIEGGTVSATPEAGYTEATNLGGGTDVRTLVVIYDDTDPIDSTPSITWTGSESVGGAGFILNAAP